MWYEIVYPNLSPIAQQAERLEPARCGIKQRLPAGLATLLPRTTVVAFGLRTGFVHVQRTAAQEKAIQSVDRTVGFMRFRHLDKRETARAARVTVRNDADAIDGAILGEKLTERFFSRAEIQVA